MAFSDPAFDALVWDKTHRGSKIDLTGYKETFRDDFDEWSIAPSQYATSGKWFAGVHASVDGCKFMKAGTVPSPYIIRDGKLTIRMSLVNGVWQSGIIQSINNSPPEYGFQQQFGYFEMRATFPRGKGCWPAFWLLSPNVHQPRLEIDIVEAYGPDWDGHHAAVHLGGVYHKDVYSALSTKAWCPRDKADLFDGKAHTYGALLTDDFLIVYYEGIEVGRFPMNDYFRTPVYMLADLAMSTKEPPDYTTRKDMVIGYIRAMAKA